MNFLKDFNRTYGGCSYPYKIREYLNLNNWLRVRKWRKQRLDRGWSDRDAWGAGDHIARMTAEMLQHLNDHAYTNWPEWFELNIAEGERGAYKDLQSVIDDIMGYLSFIETGWADGLTSRREEVNDSYSSWYDDDKKLTERQITRRIEKWQKELDKKYKRAQEAMQFFGRHFSGFWD